LPMSSKAHKFLQTVVPAVVKPLHSLWNEVIGFLFIAFAAILIRPMWRGYHEMQTDPAHPSKFILTVFFFLVMLSFGIHAFWKARKISRS